MAKTSRSVVPDRFTVPKPTPAGAARKEKADAEAADAIPASAGRWNFMAPRVFRSALSPCPCLFALLQPVPPPAFPRFPALCRGLYRARVNNRNCEALFDETRSKYEYLLFNNTD